MHLRLLWCIYAISNCLTPIPFNTNCMGSNRYIYFINLVSRKIDLKKGGFNFERQIDKTWVIQSRDHFLHSPFQTNQNKNRAILILTSLILSDYITTTIVNANTVHFPYFMMSTERLTEYNSSNEFIKIFGILY